MNKNLSNAQRRAMQYWFVDGLGELGGGLICLLLAGLFWVQQMEHRSFLWDLAFFAAAFAGAFIIRRLIQRLKERSTYPRTGYIEYHSDFENRPVVIVVAVFALLLFALQLFLSLKGSISGAQSMHWMPLIGGAIFAFIFSLAGYQAALVRLYLLAAICLLSGGALALSGLSDLRATAGLCALAGLVLLIFAARARWSYARQNPPSAEQGNGS